MMKRCHLFELLAFLLTTPSAVLGYILPLEPVAHRGSEKNAMLQNLRNGAPSFLNNGGHSRQIGKRHTMGHLNALSGNYDPFEQESIDKFAQTASDAAESMGLSTTSTQLPVSYNFHTEETAEIFNTWRQTMEDNSEKISSLSNEIMKSSSSSMNTMRDEIGSSLKSNAERLAIPPDSIFSAQRDFADAITKQFSAETLQRSKESVVDFSNYYASSLDSTYKLSEFFQAAASGKILQDSIDSVKTSAQELAEAMDMRQNAAFILLIGSFFWGSAQRSRGLEEGKRISEERIMAMESKLKATSRGVTNEEQQAEVQDLRNQMVGIVFVCVL